MIQGNVVGGAMILEGGSLVPIIANKGDDGQDSTVPGPNGWTPVFAGELDGVRTLIKVADWTGGQGTKPDIGMYIGPAGYVAAKANAFNFNAAKRVAVFSAQTNGSGVASIDYSSQAFTNPPVVKPLPATTAVLSGPTRSTVSAITTTGCTVTVEQQAIITGLISLLTGATANVLVIEA